MLAHIGFALHKAGNLQDATNHFYDYLEKDGAGDYARAVRAILDHKAMPPDSSGHTCFRTDKRP
jgi:hypothetical protein